MSTKEKYIGEAKMTETPKKKLSLKLGDKVVAPKHLSDAVKETVIQPMIDTSVAYGNQRINEIQQALNEMRSSLPEGIVINGSISQFETGTTTAFTLTASTISGNVASWNVFKGDENVYSAENTSTITFTENISTSTTYIVNCTVGDYTYRGIWSVTTMLPYYIGAGTSASSIMVSTNKHTGVNISGSYSIQVANNNRIYVIVPTGTTVEAVTMNGFVVPMSLNEILVNGTHKVYESLNQYQSGTYTILLNSYTTSQADVVESIQQWIGNEQNTRENLDDEPQDPYLGQMFFDAEAGKPKWWNGTEWVSWSNE